MARQLDNFIGKLLELRHGESFCPLRLSLGTQEVTLEWDSPLRTLPSKALQAESRWLHKEPRALVKGKSNNEKHKGKELAGYTRGNQILSLRGTHEASIARGIKEACRMPGSHFSSSASMDCVKMEVEGLNQE
ncbi:hypothetical protein PVK06_033980 [Gossypium arboreum]|uniref:Uncharacterized protein n=1 Tax=Gossypium arboreum TaxID=29729 RepID=A0ABR0NDG5_GOSAR|nr:hypothetical protein PVK06_033980 [Gossypium arboreum]